MTNNASTLDYLNQQLIDAIELARRGGTNVFEFTKEQVPDIARQVLAWEIATQAVSVASAVIILIVAGVIFKKGIKLLFGNKDDSGIPLTIFPAAAITLCSFWLFFSVQALIKPIVAPKVFIIEYARDLIKK
jgi:hypothetical protein